MWCLFTCIPQLKLPAFAGNFARVSFTVYRKLIFCYMMVNVFDVLWDGLLVNICFSSVFDPLDGVCNISSLFSILFHGFRSGFLPLHGFARKISNIILSTTLCIPVVFEWFCRSETDRRLNCTVILILCYRVILRWESF